MKRKYIIALVKHLLVLSLFISAPLFVRAERVVEYVYDDAGNRVTRR